MSTIAPCAHLAAVAGDPPPVRTDGCETCLALDMTWVHLRQCLVCGRVGCCDDSPGRHATVHFLHVGHETMRSIEPGETWRWCFADEVDSDD